MLAVMSQKKSLILSKLTLSTKAQFGAFFSPRCTSGLDPEVRSEVVYMEIEGVEAVVGVFDVDIFKSASSTGN